MSPSPLPLITERDYPAFQRAIPELLTVTYEEWLGDHERAVAYRKSRNGAIAIPVSPNEFNAWLKETSQVAHLELLWVFAEDMAAHGEQRLHS